MWLAVAGLLLSFVCFTTSGGLWAYGYQTEVPEGFRRLNFMNDISRKGFRRCSKGKADIFNPDVKALDGQKVFIKGYMYPTKQMQGLKTFLLVKDNAQCCFGGNPAMQDMIWSTWCRGRPSDFHQGILMSVAGVFHCQQASGPGRIAADLHDRRNVRRELSYDVLTRLGSTTDRFESLPAASRNRRWKRSEKLPG